MSPNLLPLQRPPEFINVYLWLFRDQYWTFSFLPDIKCRAYTIDACYHKDAAKEQFLANNNIPPTRVRFVEVPCPSASKPAITQSRRHDVPERGGDSKPAHIDGYQLPEPNRIPKRRLPVRPLRPMFGNSNY